MITQVEGMTEVADDATSKQAVETFAGVWEMGMTADFCAEQVFQHLGKIYGQVSSGLRLLCVGALSLLACWPVNLRLRHGCNVAQPRASSIAS